MTEAPERIWATINGSRVSTYSPPFLIGGWESRSRKIEREVEYVRADLAAERERKLVEALKLTVEDLEEWSGCKSTLEAAGFNMDDTQVRAEFARATLKELGYE